MEKGVCLGHDVLQIIFGESECSVSTRMDDGSESSKEDISMFQRLQKRHHSVVPRSVNMNRAFL